MFRRRSGLKSGARLDFTATLAQRPALEGAAATPLYFFVFLQFP